MALGITVSGCTAVKSSLHLVEAEQAVTRARQQGADQDAMAIYEYTMALRFLEKAREENGYADYRDAEDLAKAAVEWSEKAIQTVQNGVEVKRIDATLDEDGAAPEDLDDEDLP